MLEKMDLKTAKLEVIQKIMNVSTESLLEKIDKILEEEMIVGYSVNGKPLTRKEYNYRLEKAELEIASGDCLSQQELEKEVENW
ncbi:hypothetical protein [Algoriphagus persicinus]|uniref:hypothetical protein n=1 Tax=Algoriphagus persicinus TaxID=3108754 RepID=UPI002B3A79D6|nr:hypothetical protein [Algoriphagus sp. E1-3-M2]MEB2785755.1 hypothetical protein [Algoriphagus sp. E1-3-M2]